LGQLTELLVLGPQFQDLPLSRAEFGLQQILLFVLSADVTDLPAPYARQTPCHRYHQQPPRKANGPPGSPAGPVGGEAVVSPPAVHRAADGRGVSEGRVTPTAHHRNPPNIRDYPSAFGRVMASGIFSRMLSIRPYSSASLGANHLSRSMSRSSWSRLRPV